VAPARRKSEVNVDVALRLLVLGYAFINFAAASMGPLGVVLLSGAICGQAGFLAIWAALGPFRLWVRWLLVLLAGFGLYFVFCLGMVASVPGFTMNDEFAEMAVGSLFIPLLLLSAQFPLWIRRTLGGWQIVLADEASRHSATEARQFGPRHMLGLMAAFAVSLSLARVAMETWWPPDRPAGLLAPEVWLGLAIGCVVVCLYSAACTLPCTWACFLARDKGRGCLVAVGIWLSVSFLPILIVGAFLPSGRSVPVAAMVVIFLHFAGMECVLMSSLRLLRFAGCVMIRTGRNATPESGDGRDPVG